jgi:Family of unknown function (DUF5343)
MPVTGDTPAPYAPTTAIVGLIERHRQKGLPPVNDDVLARAGISASLISRTLQAMETLDLIDDQGKPTPTLEGLRLASESEYKQRLADWLRSAYADALSFVDPATDDEIKIRDAFRSYKPTGQQPRMVTLFTGLFAAAGVRPESKRSRSGSTTKRRAKSNGSRTEDDPINSMANPPLSPPPPSGGHDQNKHSKSVINQLLDKFPAFDPSWTDDLKAKWFDGYQRLLAMGEK